MHLAIVHSKFKKEEEEEKKKQNKTKKKHTQSLVLFDKDLGDS